MSGNIIINKDVIKGLADIEDESIQCCVTSPPYWGLRDYGVPGQMGLEPTLEEYVAKMVTVFQEVKRVLRKDGTLWLNMGDAYAANRTYQVTDGKHIDVGNTKGSVVPAGLKPKDMIGMPWRIAFALQADGWYLRSDIIWAKPNPMPESVTDRPTKSHEYIFLLTKSPRYYYDAEAIKTGMTEGAINDKRRNDDGTMIVRGSEGGFRLNSGGRQKWPGIGAQHAEQRNRGEKYEPMVVNQKVNRRTVWTIPTQAYPEAHFATFPEMIPKLCILAGTSAKGCCSKCGAPWVRLVEKTGPSTYEQVKGDMSWRDMSAEANRRGTTPSRPNSGQTRNSSGSQPHLDAFPRKTLGWEPICKCDTEIVPCTVLDPFCGSGTTLKVAQELGRECIGIELNPEYAELARKRTRVIQESMDLL